jgi:glycerol-3-phosphate acyltransferase PlsY
VTDPVHILLYLLIPLSYLIGAVPFGLIISRSKGIDLRATGSGNIGATNVLRSVGKLPALFTLAFDIFKGALPLILLSLILRDGSSPSFDLWGGIIGLTVILGHLYPVFLSFKGGKGVATGLGVMFVYSPVTLLFMVLTWLATAMITKYSSLSAIVAFTLMPLVVFVSGSSITKIIFCVIFALLIIIKHSSNIENLINSTETKIGEK